MSLSDNRAAEILCTVTSGDFPQAEIRITSRTSASFNADLPAECDLKELAGHSPAFSIELLICHTLASVLKWDCVFRHQEDTLSLLCRIPLSLQTLDRLQSPSASELEAAGRILSMLLDNLRES